MRKLVLLPLALLGFSLLAANDQPGEVTLFFTGYVRGNFEPCG